MQYYEWRRSPGGSIYYGWLPWIEQVELFGGRHQLVASPGVDTGGVIGYIDNEVSVSALRRDGRYVGSISRSRTASPSQLSLDVGGEDVSCQGHEGS